MVNACKQNCMGCTQMMHLHFTISHSYTLCYLLSHCADMWTAVCNLHNIWLTLSIFVTQNQKYDNLHHRKLSSWIELNGDLTTAKHCLLANWQCTTNFWPEHNFFKWHHHNLPATVSAVYVFVVYYPTEYSNNEINIVFVRVRFISLKFIGNCAAAIWMVECALDQFGGFVWAARMWMKETENLGKEGKMYMWNEVQCMISTLSQLKTNRSDQIKLAEI